MVAKGRTRQAAQSARGQAAKAKAGPSLAKKVKKVANATEPARLSAAQLAKIEKVMEAHALLREVGMQIEKQFARLPIQRSPQGGEQKIKTIEVHMPQGLYEQSRIARGKHKDAWKTHQEKRGAVITKRERLKRAMDLHRAAFNDDDEEEEVEAWDELPQERQTAYLAKADGAAEAEHADDEPHDEDAPGSLFKAEVCNCVDPEVAHSTLALPKAGLLVMRCFTLHGKQEVHLPIIKLHTRYDYVKQMLYVSGKTQCKAWSPPAPPTDGKDAEDAEADDLDGRDEQEDEEDDE